MPILSRTPPRWNVAGEAGRRWGAFAARAAAGLDADPAVRDLRRRGAAATADGFRAMRGAWAAAALRALWRAAASRSPAAGARR